jgi:hypothetical protein
MCGKNLDMVTLKRVVYERIFTTYISKVKQAKTVSVTFNISCVLSPEA